MNLEQHSSPGFYFAVENFRQIKQKLLRWSQRFDHFCFLDNHQYKIKPHSIECICAAGAGRKLKAAAGNALPLLQEFIDSNRHVGSQWLFGHLGYDLKNEIEKLTSSKKSGINFPDLFFFEPEILIRLNENKLIIESADAENIFKEIIRQPLTKSPSRTRLAIQNRISREEYISTVNRLKQHTLYGDCYEINFCQEFFADPALIDPIEVYQRLSEVSPNPFSALYKVEDQWLICGSPERFLKKQGNKILSQPMKGTIGRAYMDDQKDKENKRNLFQSDKERSENVMVVDLVRNDLAKICKEGTVGVEELFGIYSFPQVHQMISTVSGELRENIPFSDIIKATFPMGSMTGAPKKKVMELVDKYESIKRGIFSGALGYLSPNGDFDLNVVIRSIMYNETTNYLSYQAGSAITFYSDAEREWEECLLKTEALEKILECYISDYHH